MQAINKGPVVPPSGVLVVDVIASGGDGLSGDGLTTSVGDFSAV